MTTLSLTTDTSTAAYDPFDPVNLRLDQNFLKMAGAKKLLTTVPVRRPNKQDYVRVHQAEEYRMSVALIEFKEDSEVFLVPPSMTEALVGEWFPAMPRAILRGRYMAAAAAMEWNGTPIDVAALSELRR